MSLALLPKGLSALLVRIKVSGSLVRTLLTARATPLASGSGSAITVSTRHNRRMPFSSPYAPHRSICTKGNKTVRLALLLRRIPLPRTPVNKGWKERVGHGETNEQLGKGEGAARKVDPPHHYHS